MSTSLDTRAADRDRFVADRTPAWRQLHRDLAIQSRDAQAWSDLASAYRSVCADLSRAQTLGLPETELRYLEGLAASAHNALYGARRTSISRLWGSIAQDFPRELRRQWVFVLLAHLLFYGPFLIGAIGCFIDDGFAVRVLSAGQVESIEQMYATAGPRGADGDALMAGFYVYNNVGIAFRCFATGALFGLGSLYFLVYNGLIIGTTMGHLVSAGLGHNLLPFIAGHSAWELTGIAIAGAAGIRLGWAMIGAGELSWPDAMRAAGPELFRLMVGVATMLFIAAAIEGFWSASPVWWQLKIVFGAVQWLIVAAWLLLGGRR